MSEGIIEITLDGPVVEVEVPGLQGPAGDPTDAPELAAIAALSPSNDDLIQRKAGAWANRSLAQLTTDLSGIANDKVLTAKNTPNSGEIARFTSSGVEGRTASEAKGDLGLAVSTTDNRVIRADGTGGNTQSSAVTIDDNGVVIAPRYYSFFATLADDTAFSFTPVGALPSMLVFLGNSGEAASTALVWVRANAAPSAGSLFAGANVVVTASAALTGTTGTDGKVTISPHTDGLVYIENRLGGTRTINVALLGV